MADLPLQIPAPPGCQELPVWSGNGFLINQSLHRILCYRTGSSGWTDELTEIHEEADDENHYINVASRQHAVSRFTKWLQTVSPVVIDIGCSSGYMVKLLRQRLPTATVLAADYVRGSLEKIGAAISDVPLLQFDLTQCPLPDQCVDGIVLLNVLEHIEDDEAALHHVHRVLKTNGTAVIEVPASPHLYDIHDEQLLHFRRYCMADLAAKIERANLEILERSHLGCFLYPAFQTVKRRNQRFLHAPAEIKRAIVFSNIQRTRANFFLHAVMNLESALRDWVYFPFGIRCLVTCRRR